MLGPLVLENSPCWFATRRFDTGRPWTSFFFAERLRWTSSIRKQFWLAPVLRHLEGLMAIAKLALPLAMQTAGKSAFVYFAQPAAA